MTKLLWRLLAMVGVGVLRLVARFGPVSESTKAEIHSIEKSYQEKVSKKEGQK